MIKIYTIGDMQVMIKNTMKCYIIINEVDITQEMVNRAVGSDWLKFRRNVNKSGGALWKRVFTIAPVTPQDANSVFINYPIYTAAEMLVILKQSEWLEP